MLSETLAAGLDFVRDRGKLRALRLSKRLGLVNSAAHRPFAALLSKIERGRMYPTLPTLLRIALVFSVGLEHFFADSPAPRSPSFGRQSGRRSRTGQALRGQPIGSSAWTTRSPTGASMPTSSSSSRWAPAARGRTTTTAPRSCT